LKYLSLVVYNRDLIVIKDMDTFARYYCYAKKQKPGLAVIDKAVPAVEESSDDDKPAIEYEDVNPVTQDDDIL
jgi:hypothetical protein